MATPAQTLNLRGLLSESKKIINAHSRHFLALSVIFLLPIAFSLTIFPTLLSSSISPHPNPINTQILLSLPRTPPPLKTLILPITFFLLIYSLSLSALGTITYSTHHGFYGRPVKLGSAVKSLLRSFFPLVITTIYAMFIVILFSFLFGFGFFFLTRGAAFLGFNVESGSDCYNWLLLLVGTCFVLLLIWFHVHYCTLVYVIVVAESKWGFEALGRSRSLIRGMRLVSVWLLLFVCITVVFPLLLNSVPVVKFVGGFDVWKSLMFVLRTVLSSSFVTLFMLISVSANTVLYMYCKALQGELAVEIAEEFVREYVSLPFDDDKVPHIVTVVQA